MRDVKKLPAGNSSACYDPGQKTPRASKGAVIRSAFFTTRKHQFSQLLPAELQRAAGTRPLRMCGSTGASVARRAEPEGGVCPLRNPWGSAHSLLQILHYMQRSRSVPCERDNEISRTLSPFCNVLLGKCPLISSSEVNGSFCCAKLTGYFLILLCTSLPLTNWQSQHSCLL